MTKDELKTQLEEYQIQLNWELILYGYKYKKYNFYGVTVKTIGDILKNTIDNFKNNILSLVNDELQYLQEVMDLNDITEIPNTDAKEYRDKLFGALNDPNERDEEAAEKYTGYMLVGRDASGKICAVMVFKDNPFFTISGNKFVLYKLQHNELDLEKDIKRVQLKTSIDYIYLEESAIAISNYAYSFFELETKIEDRRNILLTEIETLDYIDNIAEYKSFCKGKRATRAFLNLTDNIMTAIRDKEALFEKAARYGIPITGNNKFDTSDKKKVENMHKFLCGKLFHHCITGELMEGSNIKKAE